MRLQAFHKLSYGMYLVASEFEGIKTGYIANTAFQVTSKPPQIAISCHKNNKSTGTILQSGVFSISVLKKELNVKLIGDFGFMSGSDLDKFKDVDTITAKTGAPIVLDESVAWFDCEVREKTDLGSHWLIIGEVLESEQVLDEEPLTYAYYREKYKMFSPKNSPTYIEKAKLDEEKKQEEQELLAEKGGTKQAESDEAVPHVCQICGYTYDPEVGDPSLGIPPGTPFEDLPEEYKCPICSAGKEYFKKQ